MVHWATSGIYGKDKFKFTAVDFVNHPDVRDFDPTITLENGDKIRVYHAGNPNIPIVYPSLVLEEYDKKMSSKRALLEKKLQEIKKAKEQKAEERKEQTTQPMMPIVPPPPPASRKVSVSNGPPQKPKGSTSDPFASVINDWFYDDDDDDPNNGLYEDCDSPYDYSDEGDDW